MSNYINAEDLKSKITKLSEDDYYTPLNEYVDGLRQRTEAILEIVDEMPSADVVEVVRCKDCKHFVETGGTRGGCFLFQGMTNPRSDDFCSEGERKETE